MFKAFTIILFLSLISQNTSDQGPRVCTICKCTDKKVVNCENLQLSSSFESSAWSDISGANSTYEEINLNNNFIGHVIPFPKLNITKLSLRKNKIVKIDDRAFKNLTKLLILDLGDNELTTNNLGPSIFQGSFSVEYFQPLNIRDLDLSNNELHSLKPLIFEHLPHIRRLNLQKNPFKILDHQTVMAISSLQEIEHLDLSYTSIKELPIGFLHSIKTLNELILKGNFLKEVPSNVLYESHNLVSLNLDYNPITAITTEKPFPEMPSLKILKISHMPGFKRIENFSMYGLKGLEHLYCRGNDKLEYISPLTFASNENDTSRPNVTSLYMNDNALRYLSESFLHMDKMKYVNLLGNNWLCDCENQWMVSDLMPILLKTHSPVNGLICSEPESMKGKHYLTMYKMKYEMRCLDYYGNNPQNDSVILITVFSIIIAAMAIGLIIIWKVRLGNCGRRNRPDYSRALYRPASSDERY